MIFTGFQLEPPSTVRSSDGPAPIAQPSCLSKNLVELTFSSTTVVIRGAALANRATKIPATIRSHGRLLLAQVLCPLKLLLLIVWQPIEAIVVNCHYQLADVARQRAVSLRVPKEH